MPVILKFILAKLVGLYVNILSLFAPKKAARLAYRFFTQPRSGKLMHNNLPGILREAQTETVTIDDTAFQTYVWPGNATTVLLVHGWESNAGRWKLLISYLKKAGCTIIALDAPAHGLTAGEEFNIPHYAVFIDYMVQRYKPQFMVGHSIGGATALYYQSHYPTTTTIKKMVVLGAPCDLRTVINNFRNTLWLAPWVVQSMKQLLTDSYKVNPDDFCGDMFATKICTPGLLIHDKKDPTVAYKEGVKIAKSWPSARFITTKGLGHSMHNAAMYEEIYDFLFGHDPMALNAGGEAGTMAG
ncbi:alpha/beta hydrolase [Flavobacterium akiainvivens]|uniref:Alpha/beta hydrolase n=1 Tax=Flavobacterium akiainvivens TaxID=1202724 RepID=A0A0N0RR47_9FLAO|nr:alpha/beta hydrolase [Flavobacterium akiainvivens]KOS07972.1 alpha/beta hydrolase [Flavobacterium akiainvivens]SFQ61416.1 Lysophospholipase, alpha-beta hydrolase superfamily [Flavobacterium akiainvivens]